MSSSSDREPFDAAALAGAILAGVLASMVAEGPFEWTNVAIGVTVLSLLIAYLGRRKRTVGKSIAFSTVFAYSSLLIFGFIFERWWPDLPNAEIYEGKSHVSHGRLLIIWLIVSSIVFVIDQVRMRWAASR